MNPEEYREDKRKKSRHEYYIKRREAALAYQREYDKQHRDKRREYMKAYNAEYSKRMKARGTVESEE